MDLKQRKLNKSEWDSIERPVSESELEILDLIMKGYHDVNLRINHTHSIFTYLKIEFSEKMEDYLYNRYLRQRVVPIETKLGEWFAGQYKPMKIDANIKPNSGDRIRLERFDDATIQSADLYESVLLGQLEKLMQSKVRGQVKEFHGAYFTLYKLSKNNVFRVNRHLVKLVRQVLDLLADQIDKSTILEHAVEFIEKNSSLFKYGDLELYEHQKEIFTAVKTPTPKLILYMAPTGTGKTMTPIALSEEKKIIFVCAARHVGLALARAAISVGKKIAFAFGCSSADDVRLHYFAAKEYTKDRRNGRIRKVDNSVGDNVQIIISDIRSYLPSMYYMLAFFPASSIVTYWDEPTITMDYESHEIHKTIRKNWRDNVIPTVVLSSATLPKERELTETIPDFLNKFPGAEICSIVSHDCKKSIPIVNTEGYVVLPHYLESQYDRLLQVADHCAEYLTLLRYFDLNEVVQFVSFVNKHQYANHKMQLDRHFETLDDISMKNIKTYYIHMLKNIGPTNWPLVYRHFEQHRQPRIAENSRVDAKGNPLQKVHSVGPEGSATAMRKGGMLSGAPLTRLASEQSAVLPTPAKGTCGVYVTTKDAYTLTDGPTIFIANNVEKIAKFCVQQADISKSIMDDLMEKIQHNNILNREIGVVEAELEAIREETDAKFKNTVNTFHGNQRVTGRSKSNKDPKKIGKTMPEEMQNKSAISSMTEKINGLRAKIKRASLHDAFVPNKKYHLEKWAPSANITNAFTSTIDDQIVCDIMALNHVDDLWKILLMMGIGVFIEHENIKYTEIMKTLADQQMLYMIIASSDYIYGTNYQFCHGFLSKDLELTQEKVIQAMGRIGRNNIQQTYSVRFRDDSQIAKLFTSETEKPEVRNMNILFNSVSVRYEEGRYVEIPEEADDPVHLGEEEDPAAAGAFDPYDEEEEDLDLVRRRELDEEEEVDLVEG